MAPIQVLLLLVLCVIVKVAADPPPKITRVIRKEDIALIKSQSSGQAPKPSLLPSALGIPFTPKDIIHHGGPVMQYGHKVYIVWYGPWTNTEKSSVRSFINSLGPQNAPSPGSVRAWWNINSLYYNATTGAFISPTISIGGEADDAGMSQGSTISQTGVVNSFKAKISAGNFPVDYTGIYLVLTNADVKVMGFSQATCLQQMFTVCYGFFPR